VVVTNHFRPENLFGYLRVPGWLRPAAGPGWRGAPASCPIPTATLELELGVSNAKRRAAHPCAATGLPQANSNSNVGVGFSLIDLTTSPRLQLQRWSWSF